LRRLSVLRNGFLNFPAAESQTGWGCLRGPGRFGCAARPSVGIWRLQLPRRLQPAVASRLVLFPGTLRPAFLSHTVGQSRVPLAIPWCDRNLLTVGDSCCGSRRFPGFEIEPRPSMMSPYSSRGGTVGFFAKLFGMGESDAAKRTVASGQICPKCGQPIPRENMAFDSGGGKPIHRTCPEAPVEAAEK